MRKQLILSIVLLLSVVAVNAQIANPGFETWTAGLPDGWYAANAGMDFITQSSTSHTGDWAARGDAVDVGGGNYASTALSLGSNGTGAPVGVAPEAIHGWYIVNSVGGDHVLVLATMSGNGNGTGAGTSYLENTSVYKEFITNVYYISGTPNGDSLYLAFQLMGTQISLHQGSYFLVDDVSFGAQSTGVEDAGTTAFGIESVGPNPSTDRTQIIYNVQNQGLTTLNVYDLSGRLVKTVVNENQTPGRYKAFAEVSDLSAGIYTCQLTTGTTQSVLKLAVQR